MRQLTIADKLAVDGSPLQMDDSVPMPSADQPLPGAVVDMNAVAKSLKKRPEYKEAEFPLRKSLATPNTTVYTNHFAMKIDASKPLYEYSIKGF
jgi:eukaryotic translation initiation factor 2C